MSRTEHKTGVRIKVQDVERIQFDDGRYEVEVQLPVSEQSKRNIARDVFAHIVAPHSERKDDDDSYEQTVVDHVINTLDEVPQVAKLRGMGFASSNAAANVAIAAVQKLASQMPGTEQGSSTDKRLYDGSHWGEFNKYFEPQPGGPAKSVRLESGEYHHRDDAFYEVTVGHTEGGGGYVERRYGKNGCKGRTLRKNYSTITGAQLQAADIIDGKIDSGYTVSSQSHAPREVSRKDAEQHLKALADDPYKKAILKQAIRDNVEKQRKSLTGLRSVARLLQCDPEAAAQDEHAMKLATYVGNDQRFKRLLDLVGQLMPSMQRSAARKRVPGVSVPVSMQPTSRIADIIPAELATLAHPGAMQKLAALRMVSGQMLGRVCRDYGARERGDMHIVLDCSASMRSDGKWDLARALCIATMVMSQKQQRKVLVTVFNDAVRRNLTVRDGDDLAAAVYAVCCLSAGGGTNFDPPMSRVAENTGPDADIVLLSDGDGHLSQFQLTRAMEGRDLHYFVIADSTRDVNSMLKDSATQFHRMGTSADPATVASMVAEATVRTRR